MKPVVHPPDPILRAYADLLQHVFCFLRIHSGEDPHKAEMISDLADAMHNIGSLFTDYGSWTDDEKYRNRYIRPFDEKWIKNEWSLEKYLEVRLAEYLK